MKNLLFILLFISIPFLLNAGLYETMWTENFKLIDVYVFYDCYPSKLNSFAVWLAEHNVNYQYSKRINDEKLYMYVLGIYDYGITTKTETWNLMQKLTGTPKSMLKDIKMNFNDNAFKKAIGIIE